MNKIEVSRSYSRKIKGKVQYEMIDVFCSLKQEVDEAELETTAHKLQGLAEQFVEKDISRLEEARDKKPKVHEGTTKVWGNLYCPNCKAKAGDGHDCDNCERCGTVPHLTSEEIREVESDINAREMEKGESAKEEVAVSAEELIN